MPSSTQNDAYPRDHRRFGLSLLPVTAAVQSPPLPLNLLHPLTLNFCSLDKVQDFCKGVSRERAGPELTEGSLENRCHPRTCLTSLISPPVWHSILWWESGQTCLDSQHSLLISRNPSCLGTGKLWSWVWRKPIPVLFGVPRLSQVWAQF